VVGYSDPTECDQSLRAHESAYGPKAQGFVRREKFLGKICEELFLGVTTTQTSNVQDSRFRCSEIVWSGKVQSLPEGLVLGDK
jgi:hypothetical protein